MNEYKRTIKTIIWNVISTLGSAISLLIIENRIGENVPNFWQYAVAIIAVVLVLILVVSLHINKLINIVGSNELIECQNSSYSICNYNNSICCGNSTFEHIKKDYILVPGEELKSQLKNKYSLMYQSDIIEGVEKSFYNKSGKEIWIVSSNLGTELADEATSFVADNLAHGIIYKEFYSEKDHDGNISITAENNAKRLKKMYNDSPNLHLITYNNEISLEGFIFEMYGIVIYHYDNDDYKMYYSVRKNGSRPIYYEAPICMSDKYCHILKKIYEQNYKKNT